MVKFTALVQFSKYVFISLFCYFLLFTCLWIFSSVLNLSELNSFIFAYGFVYLFDFYLTLRFVFVKYFRISIFIRYVCYVLGTYLLSIGFFYYTNKYLDIYYSALFVAVILFPIRFFCAKYLVYG